MEDHHEDLSREEKPAAVSFEQGAEELDLFFDAPENNMMLYGGPAIVLDQRLYKVRKPAAITFDFHLADVE